VWLFLCTCNSWFFSLFFLLFTRFKQNCAFTKDTKGSVSAASKMSLFSCRLEAQSMCSSVYMCGWRLHFRISKAVIAFTFFPNKLVKCEFSFLKYRE